MSFLNCLISKISNKLLLLDILLEVRFLGEGCRLCLLSSLLGCFGGVLGGKSSLLVGLGLGKFQVMGGFLSFCFGLSLCNFLIMGFLGKSSLQIGRAHV